MDIIKIKNNTLLLIKQGCVVFLIKVVTSIESFLAMAITVSRNK